MTRLSRSLPVLGASVALLAGGGAATATAQGSHRAERGDGHAAHQRHSAWDEQWLQSSIEGDRFEIAGGALAQQKGTSEGVRAYGARLVTDHTKSLHDAVKLAHRLGIQVPRAPSPSMQWELQIVAGFSGAQFDAAYADLEAKDHQQDIAEAQDEVHKGTNRSVRHDARHEIPTLREHLKVAEQLGGRQGEDALP
jgi:putative membrane protein